MKRTNATARLLRQPVCQALIPPRRINHMTPYHQLVSQYVDLLKEGRSFPLGGFKPVTRPKPTPDSPTALFFAPHPDDECISGGIAVRLLSQANWRVINVAVTLGSKKER